MLLKFNPDRPLLPNGGLRRGRTFIVSCLGLLAFLVNSGSRAAQAASFLSYPDLQAGRVAFVYRNDVWIVSSKGGKAQRLTADGRPKSDVHLSRDASRVAYSMTVDGNPDVYVASTDGGRASRITHHPLADRPLAWSPDGHDLLIGSRMASPHAGVSRLFRLPVTGGLPIPLALAHGETATFSPDGHQVVYTSYRDYQDESWKHYRGGRAPHLRLFNLASGASRVITQGVWSDSQPVWVGDAVYFLSERGPEHRGNLWTVSVSTGELQQLTHFSDFDVRHPSGSPDGIVFEHGGRLGLFDLHTRQVRDLEIEAPGVDIGGTRSVSVAGELQSARWGPGADQIIVAAHGEIFQIGSGGAPVINITRTSNAAERFPSASADGRQLAYFSDAAGEYQLYVSRLQGGASERITNFKDGMRFQPFWSPDNRHLAFMDSHHDISVVDVDSRKVTIVDRDPSRDPDGLKAFRPSWSPDGQWLAYARDVDSGNSAVFLYHLPSGRKTQVTSGELSEQQPVFDSGGRFLFVTSSEALEPTYGDVDTTWTYADSMRIVALSLRKGQEAVWARDCNCLTLEPGRPVAIDLDGLERRRTVMAGVARGDFAELHAVPGRLVFRRLVGAIEGQGSGSIEALDLVDGKVREMAGNVDELLDVDPSRGVLFRREKRLEVRSFGDAAPEMEVPTGKLQIVVDRKEENEQQLRDAWRYVRDFFYDRDLHGLNWPQVLERYMPLARLAHTNEDMSFVLREMAGELGAGHTWAYSGHGHPPGWSDACVGLLGADYSVSQGAYQIRKIYDGGVLAGELRSPLTGPGTGIQPGTFLLAVNGEPLTPARDPWAAFEGLCDVNVELTVNNVPRFEGARRVLVRTLKNDTKLREADWARVNRERVHGLSGGRIGYVYVPDTSKYGQTVLMRQYLAERRKQAIIVDERFNRGGAFGDRLVELLNRPPLAFFAMRNSKSVPLPQLANGGPKVMLINGWSYSGGDGFPFLFHAAHAGTLIGTQTAGGYIGPGNPLPLVSGGVISVPAQRAFGADGRWAGTERGGISPDIEVQDDPAEVARGNDRQIDAAVEFLLAKLEKQPGNEVPAAPPVESVENSQ